MAVVGLTVGINADTKNFTKNVKKMNAEMRRTETESKSLQKQLNFKWDSGKFVQAQKKAKEALQQSEVKAKALQDRLKFLDETGTDKNSAKYRNLETQLSRTKEKSVQLKTELKKLNDLKFTRLSDKLTAIGNKLSSVGRTLTTRVTGPLLAAAGAAVKFGLDLDTALRKVSTLFGDVNVDLDDLRDKIQALAGETGIASTELSEGLYQALSAGVDVTEDMATAMEFLEIATSLAKAGFTDTTSAVDAMTTVLNAYGMEATEAAKISDILLATQNKGKTTVDELAQSLSKVIPTAAALGTSFEDVSAAMAGLTAQGIPTADATTSLNGLLTQLGKSGTTASDILRNKTGKSFLELQQSGLGLSEILQILTEGAEESDVAMIDLFGSIRAAKGFLALTANEGQVFAESLDYITNSAGLTATSLEQVNGPAYDLKASLQQIKTALEDVGATLIPLVVIIAQKIANMTNSFNSLDEGVKLTILKLGGFVAAIGPVLLVIGKLTTGVGKFIGIIPKLYGALTFLAAHPIILVIVGLIALMVYLYNTNEQFKDSVLNLVSTLKSALQPALESIKKLFQTLIQVIGPLITMLATWLAPVLSWLADMFGKYLVKRIELFTFTITKINDALRFVVQAIPGFVENVIDGIEWLINGVISLINGLVDEVNKIGKYIGITLDNIDDIEMSIDLPEWDLPTQEVEVEMVGDLESATNQELELDATVNPVLDGLDLEQILQGTANLSPVATTNIDMSNKDITIEVVVENYAEEVDVDDMVRQINIKLAEAM